MQTKKFSVIIVILFSRSKKCGHLDCDGHTLQKVLLAFQTASESGGGELQARCEWKDFLFTRHFKHHWNWTGCWALTHARQQPPGTSKGAMQEVNLNSWARYRQHSGGGPGPSEDGAAPSEISCIRSHQGCECVRVFPDIEDKMSLECHMDPSCKSAAGCQKRWASLKCLNNSNLGSSSSL